MDEGFHYYHLTIDGGVFNDPGAKNYYVPAVGKAVSRSGTRRRFLCNEGSASWQRAASLFLLKEHQHSPSCICLHSATYGKDKKKYPVLYLQHGWGEDETAWSNQDTPT